MKNIPSKIAFVAGISLAFVFTFGCSGDSGGGGTGGNGEQSNISSGTEANAEASSSSKETDKSSSSGTEIGNSSSSSLSSSDSSSSSTGSEVAGSVKKDKINGFSQKGPFTKGSAITLSELNDKLAQTGRSFEEIIADDKGSFEIKNIELVSPYVMLKANGYYRNEVSGKISSAPINLYAIADIREKSNVNVNILTHLEYYRIQRLVEGGKSLKDAKKQAQKEILAVFGINGEFKDSEDMSIFGTTDADAVLLAISILLQGELSEGQFVERLADFNLGFRETGTWDNKTAKDAMADWASNNKRIEYCEYGSTPELQSNCWPMPTGDMCRSGKIVPSCSGGSEFYNVLSLAKSNILGWNLSSSIPDFEKFVNIFWSANYGLGTCDAKEVGKIKEGSNDKKYICSNDKAWEIATEYEILLGLCSKEGEIKEGEVISDSKVGTKTKEYFICKDKAWTGATEYERDIYQWVCSKTDEVKTGQVSGIKYACKNNVWAIAPKCLESKSCLNFTDARDKQLYYSVKIGEQTWMAENLSYDTKTTSSVCYGNDPSNCNLYGRLYDWETAKKSCPTGWHLPSNDEWQKLVDFAGGKNVAGKKLKATVGWNRGNGTDDYGFSALPSGFRKSGSFWYIGDRVNWWSSNEVWELSDILSKDGGYSKDDGFLFSVRCLQD